MKQGFCFFLKKNLLAAAVLLIIAASLAILAKAAFAAPMPPRTVINHKAHQCAQIVPGDECGDVILPPDWEYLNTAAGEACPAGYTMVDLRPAWTHFKAQHCCSEGHSGTSGDCQDVIKQADKGQCAFVEDIQQCSSLPAGWEPWGQDCPAGFKWVDDMACATGASNPTVNVTTVVQTTPAAPTTGTEATPASTPAARNPLCPCASIGMALILAARLWLRRT